MLVYMARGGDIMNIIVALEEKLYSDKYDAKYYYNLLLILYKYFECDNCEWHFRINSMRRDDIIRINNFTGGYKYKLSIVVNDRIEEVILYNPKCIDTSLFDYISLFLKNVRLIDERIKFLMTDKLVGVLNSDSLADLINSNNSYSNIGVCFIDCNGLKSINDMYGHGEGDKFLVTVSNCIKRYIRKDEIYRKGGDEFVVICDNISMDLFYNKMELIRNEIIKNNYSASFGYVYSVSCNDLSKMIAEADKLMYLEKEEYYRKNNVRRRIK